jgi:hypothetical protein
MPVGAVWKPDSLTAPAASRFIDIWLRSAATETKERDVATHPQQPVARLREIPSDRKDTDLWSASAPNQRKRECGILTVCLSRFSGGQGSRRLLKCVVGSHQASFLPSEEESFVMDYIS